MELSTGKAGLPAYYGTLLEKTSEAVNEGRHLLLDLDVKGALNLKKLFPATRCLCLFALRAWRFLRTPAGKGSEDEASLNLRLQRAALGA